MSVNNDTSPNLWKVFFFVVAAIVLAFLALKLVFWIIGQIIGILIFAVVVAAVGILLYYLFANSSSKSHS